MKYFTPLHFYRSDHDPNRLGTISLKELKPLLENSSRISSEISVFRDTPIYGKLIHPKFYGYRFSFCKVFGKHIQSVLVFWCVSHAGMPQILFQAFSPGYVFQKSVQLRYLTKTELVLIKFTWIRFPEIGLCPGKLNFRKIFWMSFPEFANKV